MRPVIELLITLAVALLLAALFGALFPASAAGVPAGEDALEATLEYLPCAQPGASRDDCVTPEAAEHWLAGHEREEYLRYRWRCALVLSGGRVCVQPVMVPRLTTGGTP